MRFAYDDMQTPCDAIRFSLFTTLIEYIHGRKTFMFLQLCFEPTVKYRYLTLHKRFCIDLTSRRPSADSNINYKNKRHKNRRQCRLWALNTENKTTEISDG